MKVIFTLFLSLKLFSFEKAIYGLDDRLPINQTTDSQIREKARSIAIMVQKTSQKKILGGALTKIVGTSIKNEYSLCNDEPGYDNFTMGKCTGFLVGEDLLVTAGHCVSNETICREELTWVFDFRDGLFLKNGRKDEIFIPSINIFACKELVLREYDYLNKIDFAIIRLEHKVLNRPILKIRTEGKLPDNANLYIIGHPLGVSMRFADNALVIKNSDPFFFKTNLDSFLGNSGSPIFNKDNGLVEGILVRGESDFQRDERENCERFNFCPQDGLGCIGEDGTRISTIAPYLNQILFKGKAGSQTNFWKSSNKTFNSIRL